MRLLKRVLQTVKAAAPVAAAALPAKPAAIATAIGKAAEAADRKLDERKK